jgi:Ca-activated chloride channel homolog
VRKAFPVWIFAVVLVAVIGKRCASPDTADTAQPVAAVPADVVDTAPTEAQPVASEGPQSWPSLREGVAASPSETINYYIVFDGSGSMRSQECGDGVSKMEAAVQAVTRFIKSAPATANIGLAAFDRKGTFERVALGADNRDALGTALLRIDAGSGTPLNSGIRIGYEKLTNQARTQLGYGEYHLVVVTDGKAEPSSEDPTPVVQEMLQDSPVVLHTIGFCIDASHVLNQQGRTYYASATSPKELQASLQAVLAEAPTFDVAKFQ